MSIILTDRILRIFPIIGYNVVICLMAIYNGSISPTPGILPTKDMAVVKRYVTNIFPMEEITSVVDAGGFFTIKSNNEDNLAL